ncbi:MAG: TIGR00730 family Rossman fold protein [Saprospiraceae bacterium]|nr:TIGR00730 family Rossman fold protein [Saprospiraceae bacterium]
MDSICVFCGSSPGKRGYYVEEAKNLGAHLARQNTTLIYGGASIGIMGALADAVMQEGGQVIGVIPSFLSKKEVRHDGLTQLIEVDSMHQRKRKMAALARGFIAMPGGFGTMEEFFEVMTWAQLGLVKHPIGLFNVDGYFNALLAMMDHMVAEGFLKPENRRMLLIDNTPSGLLKQMLDFKPIMVPKWLDQEET